MINIFKLTRMVRINDKDVEDILCAAFEGGINYWCDDVTPIGDWLGEYASEHIANGGTAELHDTEEDKRHRIDAGAGGAEAEEPVHREQRQRAGGHRDGDDGRGGQENRGRHHQR